jgi:hypothetical protein
MTNDVLKEAQPVYAQPEVQNVQVLPETKRRKQVFGLPALLKVEREGPDYLKGGHASEQDFQNLGIRSLTFGASMRETERTEAMDRCYEALRDLEAVLQLSAGEISFHGKLGLAFGNRRKSSGTGADFDPEERVIHIGRMTGAGYLAHAWAHALDDAFGQEADHDEMAGTHFMSQKINTVQPESVKRLCQTIREKKIPCADLDLPPKTGMLYRNQTQQTLWRLFTEIKPVIRLTEEKKEAWEQAVEDIFTHLRDSGLDHILSETYRNPYVDHLSNVRRYILGVGIPEKWKQDINHALQDLCFWEEGRAFDASDAFTYCALSDYHRSSGRMDDYFAKTTFGEYSSYPEEFARAFDCYIHDKLKEQGYTNTYLTAFSEQYRFRDPDGTLICAVPLGREREQIHQSFDRMFQEIRERGMQQEQQTKTSLRDVKKIAGTRRSGGASVYHVRQQPTRNR